jgi:hypothetical protein
MILKHQQNKLLLLLGIELKNPSNINKNLGPVQDGGKNWNFLFLPV